VIILGMALIAALGVPWLAGRSLNQSRDAAAHGDLVTALDKADRARSLQPWAESPQVQIALVHEEQGKLDDARRAIELAIRANPDDWRTWLISSRIARASGHADSASEQYARARSLNPRSPLFGGDK
jgi:Tfp pilus assembly protein PilF